MPHSDLSANAKALHAIHVGPSPNPSEANSQPAYLMDQAILLFPVIKGDYAYLLRLEDAAKDLYRRLKADPSVLSYIESGKSVLRDDATRGVIKPILPNHEPDDRKALKWLLHSMAFISSSPTVREDEKGVIHDRKYVGIPLTDAKFGKGEGKFPLKRDRLSQMLYALAGFNGHGSAWVRLIAGRHDINTRRGVTTRLEPLIPIKDFLVQHQLVFVGHPEPKKKVKPKGKGVTSILTVNVAPKGKKKADKHTLDRDLTENESVLPLLNAKLAKQQLTLHLPDYAAYQRHWKDKEGQSRLKMWGNKQLHRAFRYQDGTAGRVYGHFVQQLPSDSRQYLRIDKQPVVELDYNAMQLAILYAHHGLPTPEGDLYKMAGGDRDLMKMVLTHSVGNATKADTVQSLKQKLRDDLRDPNKAEGLYDQFWEVHKAVCPHDAEDQGPWPWLQNIDSEIALRVLRLLYDQDIYAIPVHDSFIVKARHKDAVEAAMQQAWKEQYPGRKIGIKVTDAQAKLQEET